MIDKTDFETKAAGSDAVRAYDDIAEAFEAFKDSNEQRLSEIERRGTSDVVTSEKLARIEGTLDRLTLKSARPPMSSGAFPIAAPQHKSAFDSYVRKGDAARLLKLEEKALSVGSGPDGGYLD